MSEKDKAMTEQGARRGNQRGGILDRAARALEFYDGGRSGGSSDRALFKGSTQPKGL